MSSPHKLTYGMESDVRSIIVDTTGRPAVKVAGKIFIGKARRSELSAGDRVQVLYRPSALPHCRSIVVTPVDSKGKQSGEAERFTLKTHFFGEESSSA